MISGRVGGGHQMKSRILFGIVALAMAALAAPAAAQTPFACTGETYIISPDSGGQSAARRLFNPCIGFNVDIGASFPTNSPELTGNAQNLDLNTGFVVSGGPFIQIPIAQAPGLGTVSVRGGVDGFYRNLGANQITNQNGSGSLAVGGTWDQYGVIPYVGLAFLTDIQVEFIIHAGYGVARQNIDLTQNGASLLSGSGTTGILRIGGRVEVPVIQNVRLGFFANYSTTDGIDTTVTGSGAVQRFGNMSTFEAGISGTVFLDEILVSR